MSALNDEQMKTVAAWFAAGATLDELQKRIKSELDVHMTYLDLRLLVAELPQPVEEKPAEKPAEPEIAAPADAPYAVDEDLPEERPVPVPEIDAPEPPPAGDVVVDMSPIAIPGTIASGTVTFSDGKSGKWFLDQTGQMGLSGFEPGYRPSPTDAGMFQRKLIELLRAKGMM